MRNSILVLTLAALLVGCGLQEEHLPDGTRCAVYTFGYGVSIDCDWGSTP